MKPHKGTTLVLSILLTVTITGCGGSGQILSSVEENPNINLELIAAEPLLEQLCEKVSSCLTEVTQEACLTEGRASEGLVYSVTGITPLDDPAVATPIYTYQDLVEDETAGTIQAKSLAYDQCTSALQSVQCEIVEAIYWEDLWEDLPIASTLVDVVDYTTSCTVVFSRSEEDATCEAGGAQARWFSSGCADHCGASAACTAAFDYDCDCGEGYCWNGSNCEEI